MLERFKAREQELLSALNDLQRQSLKVEGALLECREMMARAEREVGETDKGGSVRGRQGPLNRKRSKA